MTFFRFSYRAQHSSKDPHQCLYAMGMSPSNRKGVVNIYAISGVVNWLSVNWGRLLSDHHSSSVAEMHHSVRA